MSEQEHQPNIVAAAVNAQKLDAILGDMGELKNAVRELTRSVNRLAILEERLATNADSLGRAFKEIEKIDARVTGLEMAQPIQKQSSDIVQKVVALVLAAVLGATVSSAITVSRRDNPVIPTPAPAGK